MNSFNMNIKLDGNLKADLHMHSSASDGTWRPEKLVQKVLEAGISIFALTDHDTTENVCKVSNLACQAKLLYIPGVEVNTSHEAYQYHILGLGIDIENCGLQALIKRNREQFEEVDRKCLEYLAKQYHTISLTEFEAYENNRERGGWKVLNYVIDKKLCVNHKDFYKLIDGLNPFEGLKLAAAEEAVVAILSAGGVPVLAHPGVSFYTTDYKTLIEYMLNSGVQGIECYHPDNPPEITQYCLGICKAKDLLVTGGSDCHGDFLKARGLGYPDIRLSQLNLGRLLK